MQEGEFEFDDGEIFAGGEQEEEEMLILNWTVIYFTKSGHFLAILSDFAKASSFSSAGRYHIGVWAILVADYIKCFTPR